MEQTKVLPSATASPMVNVAGPTPPPPAARSRLTHPSQLMRASQMAVDGHLPASDASNQSATALALPAPAASMHNIFVCHDCRNVLTRCPSFSDGDSREQRCRTDRSDTRCLLLIVSRPHDNHTYPLVCLYELICFDLCHTIAILTHLFVLCVYLL
jgi:hypothetical protein